MYRDYRFEDVLGASQRAAWRLEDVMGPDRSLDFARPFMPEALARTDGLGLGTHERRLLNQIRGHEYLCIFGLVEEFILPFILDHARPQLDGDDWRVRAFLQFASEEAKHIHLFRLFHAAFKAGFPAECAVIGPAPAIGAEVLRHDPLAVALLILHIEWMTQAHYVESVRDDGDLDPLFKSLLKHHWMEEAQHAKLDTLMVEALADACGAAEIETAFDEYLEIGMFIDAGLKQQTRFNLDAFETVAGPVAEEARDAIASAQHQAARWTYLGSGMTHPRFRATLGAISPAALKRLDALAPAFC